MCINKKIKKSLKGKKPKRNEDISSKEKREEAKSKKYVNKQKWISGKNEDTSSEEKEQSEEASCIFCSEFYLKCKSGDGWVKCQHCQGWAYEACAGLENDEDGEFIWDLCR